MTPEQTKQIIKGNYQDRLNSYKFAVTRETLVVILCSRTIINKWWVEKTLLGGKIYSTFVK